MKTGNLTLAMIKDQPEVIAATITLNQRERIVFRPLKGDDATRLGAYFEGLSLDTRSRFGPHEFTLVVAQTLCGQIYQDHALRLIALTGAGKAAEVIAYFILDFAISEGDQQRYLAYGIPLNHETDCKFAPSVADRYQNLGLGSALMPICKDIARRLGYQRAILMGGVLISNQRAVHFYEKAGYRQVGSFNEGTAKASYDMILSIR